MLGDLLSKALGPIMDGVLRFIPDKNERSRAKELFETQMLGAMSSIVQGQLAINAKEAEHGSIFVAGWRPAIGWICGFALGWSFVLQPMATWTILVVGVDLPDLPVIELGPLLSILMGMLGLGGLRTYEKRLGVARTGVKNDS